MSANKQNNYSGIIYHITTADAWDKSLKNGKYENESLVKEGFIHCSTHNQVTGVLERYFKNKEDLVKLVIDINKIQPLLKFEQSPTINEEFPHIYGPLNIDAVIQVQPLTLESKAAEK